MVCNEEEDPKSPFNGWLKAYQVAIDLREEILSAQGIKSTNQKIQLTGYRSDQTQQAGGREPAWQGRRNAARAAFSAVFP